MGSEFKIYTKGGDKGQTSLLGGTRVPKYHERIEAYGTVDELTSFIGLIRDQEITDFQKQFLIQVQYNLFTIESHLAADKPENALKLPKLTEDDILTLENEIDRMNEYLPELRSFILPGGHPIVSYCHIARTVCRRSERLVIKLTEKYNIDEIIVKYLNRLSDFLFVLARKIALDNQAEETPWKPLK
ncbi:MAG: cob(I)yrinic acid a,c-diamide adenosyltransferase [Bacteroidales bacterium]|nr:cob(I)yrinic acid a,c-diamide adenosyltransferase [Bacteroidales bacterium]